MAIFRGAGKADSNAPAGTFPPGKRAGRFPHSGFFRRRPKINV